MPYCWRTDTLRAVVIGGMAPKASSRGKQRHSPASRAVMQAKHGKHQKAKQPETQTIIQNTYLPLHYRMRNRKWCLLEAPVCFITAANLQSDIYWRAPSADHWEANLHEANLNLPEIYDTLSVLYFLNTSVPWKPFQRVSVLTLWQVAPAVTDPRAPSVGHCDKGPRLGLDRGVNHDISFRAVREVIFCEVYNIQTYNRQVFSPGKVSMKHCNHLYFGQFAVLLKQK